MSTVLTNTETAITNPPRPPYAFRVFHRDGWVWLYDDSSRTFACSATPSVWAEPLYPYDESEQGEEWGAMPEPGYFAVRLFTDGGPQVQDSEPLPGVWSGEANERDAWDEAREEASGNHIL